MSNIFQNEPRESLIFAPTPLHPAKNLSSDLGIDLWFKRDDLTGPSAFGGNKMRKLEFILGDAKANGADTVITYGASQSNHAMQTAAACARSGFKCILFLVSFVPPDEDALKGNILLDKLFGAEVHLISPEPGESEDDAFEKCFALGDERIKELEKEGHKCVNVPIGGANLIGCMGFASGYIEMREQLELLGRQPFDFIYHATGSTGTLAGLLAGRAIMGGSEIIRAVRIGVGPDAYKTRAAELANEVMAHLGRPARVKEDDFEVCDGYVGPGYEIPYAESTAALRLIARSEGLTLDPVYSGKAFTGLLDHARTGVIKPGQSALFWCTGGTAALFAEPEIVGDLFE